jgi:diguanylate cyclase (GGDEF)-like protein
LTAPSPGCSALIAGTAPDTTDNLAVSTGTDRGSANRLFAWLCVAVAASSVGCAVWLLLGTGGPSTTRAVEDLADLVAAGVAAASCGLAARRHRGRTHRAWTLMGLSAAVWGAGQAVWSWDELVRHHQMPFPSPADVGFLAALPLAILAALSFPAGRREERRDTRVRGILDGLIIATGLLAVSWAAVLQTVAAAHPGHGAVEALALAYPMGDVVVGTLLLGLAVRTTRATRLPLLLLAGGLGATTLADSGFAELMATRTAGVPADVVAVGRLAGYLLVALAALRATQWPLPRPERRPMPSRVGLALPYLPMAVATVLELATAVSSRRLGPFLIASLLLLVLLVGVRQYLALADNLRLMNDLQQREQALEHQAYHDALTGLPNRALLRERVDGAVVRGRGEEASLLAVMFVDLDDFKHVNDRFGHEAGDRLLIAIARRLRTCVRPDDVVARLGGDEFAILLDDLSGVDDAFTVAERIVDALAGPVDLGACAVVVGGTVGVALARPGEAGGEELLRRADVAMYRGKERGKGRVGFYEPGMDEVLSRRLERRAELARALEKQQFVLHYQPIVELDGERPVAVEALLRWDHPRDGLLLPDSFLAELEESDLMLPLGTWVLHTACAEIATLRQQTGVPVAVSVNVSSRQLIAGDVGGAVRSALAASGLAPDALVVELTESGSSIDGEAVAGRLRALKRLGVRLALDDFGTGCSSFGQLRGLSVDLLKVDRSFVGDLGADTQATRLAEALIGIGSRLGIPVVAEGVETPLQRAALGRLGCPLIQGDSFSAALPLDELRALLVREADARAGAGLGAA